MLSKKLTDKNKALTICRKSRKITPGDSFRCVIVEEDSLYPLPKDTAVICCGAISREEMLFRTEDGRYYFSLVDGWGSEGDTLYGLDVDLFFDFKHPTDAAVIREECNAALGTYSTWCGAMAYHHRKDMFEKILKVME